MLNLREIKLQEKIMEEKEIMEEKNDCLTLLWSLEAA